MPSPEQPAEPKDALITVADLMRRLSISRSKAYALLEELPHLRIGGAIRIRESALGAFLKRCEVTI